MVIAIGSDHAGFHLKEHVKRVLEAEGHEIVDVGTATSESVDYPAFAEQAARLVGDGQAERAVLACGSGVGVAIVANKVAGVRAVNAHDPGEIEMARRHNDANTVTLSGSRLAPADADRIVERFLRTGFEGGRHARRVSQISILDGSVVRDPVAG
jgi:ribose 5-phosphate isomerase B